MAEREQDTNASTDAGNDDERAHERAAQELEEFSNQDELPADPSDWPDGKARFKTFGEEGEPYGDGPTEKLGPADVVHHPDGSVSVGGEKADDPDRYKGEPIPGGPTDPNAPGGPESQAASDEDEHDESGSDAGGDEARDRGDDAA